MLVLFCRFYFPFPSRVEISPWGAGQLHWVVLTNPPLSPWVRHIQERGSTLVWGGLMSQGALSLSPLLSLGLCWSPLSSLSSLTWFPAQNIHLRISKNGLFVFFTYFLSAAVSSKNTKCSFPSSLYKTLWLGRDHISRGESKSRKMRWPGCGTDSTSFLREWHAHSALQVSV